jgi:hypothetical protein
VNDVALQYACLFLPGDIWWRLNGSEALTPPLASLGGFAVVSPFALKGPVLPLDDSIVAFALCKGANGYLARSKMLTLACEKSESSKEQISTALNAIPRFLGTLRVVTGQALLPRTYCGYSPFEADSPDSPGKPTAQETALVRRYMCSVATEWHHLLAADSLITNDATPVHGELICDATESLWLDNYRSSILYSAMAIEVCAGSALDRDYEQLLSNSVESTAHRLVTIQVNAKESIRQDPIYLALRGSSGDGGSKFLSLLHEVPQYLLRRSLKYQEPDLYRRLMRFTELEIR